MRGFITVGLLNALAALILISRVGTALATTADAYSLDALAAIVVGGVSITGGKGTAMSVFLGVLLIGLVGNALVVMNINPYLRGVAIGAIIIISVTFGEMSDTKRYNNNSKGVLIMSNLETISLLNTIKGSRFETFFPKEWDMSRIDYCCSRKPEDVYKRESWWHKDFSPVGAETLQDFNTIMGHEIAMQIKLAKDNCQDIVMIWSVGPMGMYRWAVEFLKQWKVDCSHVHGFNMKEWSDSEGTTLTSSDPVAFNHE